jgi:ADP-ribose pyrophosphatase YjhB (NUDIX family)
MEDARTKVVTVFLLRPGASGEEILLLRRSGRVGTYRGRWAGVSGYLESTPEVQAYTELREEVGLGAEDVRLIRQGTALPVDDMDTGRHWLVHPFLFALTGEREPAIDWEHEEARWVAPSALADFETVPGLAAALARVYPPRGGAR